MREERCQEKLNDIGWKTPGERAAGALNFYTCYIMRKKEEESFLLGSAGEFTSAHIGMSFSIWS